MKEDTGVLKIKSRITFKNSHIDGNEHKTQPERVSQVSALVYIYHIRCNVTIRVDSQLTNNFFFFFLHI